jgi:hypothetical protein
VNGPESIPYIILVGVSAILWLDFFHARRARREQHIRELSLPPGLFDKLRKWLTAVAAPNRIAAATWDIPAPAAVAAAMAAPIGATAEVMAEAAAAAGVVVAAAEAEAATKRRPADISIQLRQHHPAQLVRRAFQLEADPAG